MDKRSFIKGINILTRLITSTRKLKNQEEFSWKSLGSESTNTTSMFWFQ